MAITYNRDKRSGKTYAYETTYTWDKEKKQSRSKRTLIGRLDEETGEIVPKSGVLIMSRKKPQCRLRFLNFRQNSPGSAGKTIPSGNKSRN